ncbi:MAG TPA: ATP-binding protein [Hanamia sp.]
MKPFKIILFFLFFGINFCKAQDSAVVLSTSMFDKTTQQILLAGKDGWIFKQGNDTAWAKKDLDIAGWKKLKPTEISAKLADKNGRAEGWFRIKINPDSSFRNMPIAFSSGSWAAVDLYVDGKLVSSYGNTGVNGKPFKEQRHTFDPPVPVNLMPGKDHIIALHFVDYVAPLPPRRLKSEDVPLQNFIRLTSTKHISWAIKSLIQGYTYETIWVVVCFILSILFWLLYFQNRNEKNLRLIALCASCFALGAFFGARENAAGISYDSFTVYSFAQALFLETALIIIPFLLAKIFKRKLSRPLKIFLLIILIAFISIFFISNTTGNILIGISVLSLIVICLYYIISSWEKLKGAQWAIVAGVLLSLFFILLFFFINIFYESILPQYYYLFITGFALSFPLSLLVYVSMRFKEFIKEVQQNAKHIVQLSEERKEQALNQQKVLQEEVNKQTTEIRTTLDNLKSTQSQLIQSEKMASLGELTAGIAHEIQNPLNFVNNFSDVNKELLIEMKDEMDKGNTEDAKAIANDIITNEEKINHHGKRAGDIVKGMLQHSRSSTGVKEPTDINALADEYLRLSYHGLRAKDKEFNATMKTDFDESIGKINIIPQDMGRVLLNLYNNAFYAVNQQKNKNLNSYNPTVSVTTKKSDNHVIITVSDNGNGIPQNIVDKIFQPFFTTKPTGEGTGLGLSLSYDIVKAHSGTLKVETREGEGSEFIILLSIN